MRLNGLIFFADYTSDLVGKVTSPKLLTNNFKLVTFQKEFSPRLRSLKDHASYGFVKAGYSSAPGFVFMIRGSLTKTCLDLTFI